GNGMLGDIPVIVDLVTGRVTSGLDGYTLPVADLNANGTPDFQEAGVAANITTEPVDQIFVLAGSSTFSVITDLAAGDESFQWEESIDNGITWNTLAEGGDYTGVTTADLTVSTPDFTKVNYRYRVLVSNIAYACDPVTESTDVTFITPGDFDNDTIFDVVDEDDDNDGILDVDEDNGVVDRDTDGDGNPDRIDLDADGDGCFDVTEAGFTDGDGDGELGDFPVLVDANGLITDDALGPIGDGYTTPNDLDINGTYDFQEAGAAATITTEPTDQPLIIGVSTFSVVATADTYQWEESQDGGTTWVALVDGGDYAGATLADLLVTNSDLTKLTYRYRVIVSNIAYACDPTTTSVEAGYFAPDDFDLDGVYDIVDVDDDNDGILDTDEGDGLIDTDGDGSPDNLDLDADGDGCFDVTEAGFTDVNGNGMLGDGSPTVDLNGQVTSGTDGYTTPADADGNGTPDFQEAGAAATITTEPTDQDLFPTLSATFSVTATADTYQWEESIDAGATWTPITDGGNYSGATTADLTISNLDVAMRDNLYRVNVNNIAYACDPVTTSATAGFISLLDTDGDNVPDLADLDDDNDGILDTDEGDGAVDTDGDGIPDSLSLDSDGDGCSDVTEAGFENNGADMLGNQNPPTVDANGQVTSATDGYTTPNDLDNNGTPDFQEAGVAATITTQPVDQDFDYGNTATFSVVTTGDTYQWEESTDNGATWTSLIEGGDYTGVNTDQLTVSNADINMYFNDYRVVVNNIAFACDPGTPSDVVTYNELPDSDNDTIFDIIDTDDDNDGILDTVEGDGDTDGDGLPDRIDLDSDNDGCPDVTEAGFTNNGADMLGTSNPPTIDANGQVTSSDDGYTTPNDLNTNGVFDFQEAGSASDITSQPVDTEITLGDDATFTVSGNATYYQWQVSTDRGSTWVDVEESDKYSGTSTSTLTIYDARSREESNLYRVLLTSPDYACDPNPELYSAAAMLSFNSLLLPNGFSPNGDGKNDTFIVTGLAQYPNFTMEVFDRWGNSVYRYENNGSLDPQWWDGYAKGSMILNDGERVPAATYFYMINYNDDNESPRKGWVYVNY
ncbi:MAG: gliding motility-associated C-terminal domain-containing protein, partial [Bacteroidota bacterium]